MEHIDTIADYGHDTQCPYVITPIIFDDILRQGAWSMLDILHVNNYHISFNSLLSLISPNTWQNRYLDIIIANGIVPTRLKPFQAALVRVGSKKSFEAYFDASQIITREIYDNAMYRSCTFVTKKLIPIMQDEHLKDFCHRIQDVTSLKTFLKLKGTSYAFEKINGLTSVESRVFASSYATAYHLIKVGVHPGASLAFKRIREYYIEMKIQRRLTLLKAITLLRKNISTVIVKGTSKKGWKRAIVSTARLPDHLTRHIISFL